MKNNNKTSMIGTFILIIMLISCIISAISISHGQVNIPTLIITLITSLAFCTLQLVVIHFLSAVGVSSSKLMLKIVTLMIVFGVFLLTLVTTFNAIRSDIDEHKMHNEKQDDIFSEQTETKNKIDENNTDREDNPLLKLKSIKKQKELTLQIDEKNEEIDRLSNESRDVSEYVEEIKISDQVTKDAVEGYDYDKNAYYIVKLKDSYKGHGGYRFSTSKINGNKMKQLTSEDQPFSITVSNSDVDYSTINRIMSVNSLSKEKSDELNRKVVSLKKEVVQLRKKTKNNMESIDRDVMKYLGKEDNNIGTADYHDEDVKRMRDNARVSVLVDRAYIKNLSTDKEHNVKQIYYFVTNQENY